MMEWSLSVRSALEAENALEASLRQSMESLEPSLRPPFSLAIPNPDQYALLNRAILNALLTEPRLANTHIKHLHALVTDGYATFLNLLLNLVLQLFPKLLHPVKTQLLWLTHQMLRVSAIGYDSLLLSLLRHIPAAHSSQDNFMLCSHMSALFFQHFDRFLEDAPHVLSSALYTFLRVLSYHSRVNVQNENFEALKRLETHLCVKIVREEFHLCLKIGRDVIRLMQDLVHVPEFKAILHDILFNPSVFNVVGFKDVSQIYCSRTSSRYSLLRISPEMETQLRFLLTNIKLGHHKRHQVWFANKFLNEPDKEFVIVDIVRFICCGHHSPNEIIQSDIFPRWALIGWLLTCCRSKHVEASVKLALFYEWLFFDERVDSIMNIEPAILLMVHSLPKFVHMTHALLEFLLHLVDQYDSGRKGLILLASPQWPSYINQRKNASPADDILRLSQMNTDLFGGVDAVVKYVLEGHDRGVNWASFHPTLPLIVSAADDHQVKLWRMNDTKAWAVDTLRGHMNNVSCVMFLAKQDIIVSNSEDKSIRIWDATKRTGIQTFRREHDRFWILAAHPEMNLLAAGHDSGMIVFKLERERPAFIVSGDSLFYTKDWFLCFYEFSTQRDAQVLPFRRPGSLSLNQSPKTLSYSPTENAFLLCSDVDGGSYELYCVSKDGYGRGDVQDAKKGHGASAVFVARNRFAVLEKSSNQVLIKNLKNDIVKKSVLPIATDAIFYAGTGNLLCRSEDRVVIFDLQQRIVLGELQTPCIKYVVWSDDMERVALISKHAIIIANKKLVHQCTLHETIRVKSGAWDENGVLIYTTLNHIKYSLPNGDNGIIKTLDIPIYITKVTGNTIFCLDRDGKNRAIIIDATEYIFKLSLLKKKYDHAMNMIRNSQLCGQAMIAYLQQKGFPEVALHFVKDEKIRFNLALESGNIQIAVASATAIDEKDHWYRLGVEALRQGNAGIVEYAYQRTKNFERLSFLYLVTGNMEKVSKMLKIAEVKNDVMGQFHNALYMGDVRERVKILENVGHLPLAYVTASVHGLNDVAERLAAELGDNVPSLPAGKVPSLMMPPSPVMCGSDWPLLRVMRGMFDGVLNNTGRE